MGKFVKIQEDKVSCKYACPIPDCDETAEVNPGWHEENGTPMCTSCDLDMSYIQTEVWTDE